MTTQGIQNPSSTAYHARFWAESLTRIGPNGGIDQIGTTLSNARLDLNPHQIDAALFAIRSPLSQGAILADEVGLGKTIEAGLVILQRWAERKRKILLILPATLRTQWQQELSGKFGIPASILEATTFNRQRKQGVHNPFDRDGIVIISYHFAAKQAKEIGAISWDLVVIDEAHRLRNVYKNSNKLSQSILKATEGRSKLLLTATPLQNSLLELFGLTQFIDPLLFGDLDSFREQFVNVRAERERNTRLRERLATICTRTLRKQVAAYVSFTARLPITQEFIPSDAEQSLYDAVSDYLQRADLHALPPSQRTLMTLVLRKLLASSSFAIAATLRRLVDRLELKLKEDGSNTSINDIVGEEFEGLEETEDEWQEDESAPAMTPRKSLIAELQTLKQQAEQAEAITSNAKAVALLQALEVAFQKLASLGAQRKAVIFTESRRTQDYLHNLLSDNGYDGRIVMINGSNADPGSKKIYQAWKERNGNPKTPVTGSVSADMKAALVEEFKSDRSTILLATESAAEGVNLQFCSLIVNYDLPWNPQRVEQRIGRCHRYGQKHDVVVVNFLNKRNEADQRVFELLAEKFRLFEGVFGSSDEVLGSLESGVDIERRIAQVYQTCRTQAEIKAAFDALQREVEDQIQNRMTETRRSLLDNFDADVHDRLAIHHDQARQTLSRIQGDLLAFLRHELKGAVFDAEKPCFSWNGERYCLDWRQAEQLHATFIGTNHPVTEAKLQESLSRPLEIKHLFFDLSNNRVNVAALDVLHGQSGWMSCSRLSVAHANKEEFQIIVGMTDKGVALDDEQCRKLFLLNATEHDMKAISENPLAAMVQRRQAELVQEVEQRNASYFDEQAKKLDAWADDRKYALEVAIKTMATEIKVARNRVALVPTLAEKAAILKEVKALEQKRVSLRRELFDAEDQIDSDREALLNEISKRLASTCEMKESFLIRWTVK